MLNDDKNAWLDQFDDLEIESEDLITSLHKMIDGMNYSAVLCRSSHKNPSILTMFYCNDKFTAAFDFKNRQISGRDYAFLFRNIDIDSYSTNQIQYSKLQKAAKAFQPTSVVIKMDDHVANKVRNFRINFNPNIASDENYSYCTLSFKKLAAKKTEGKVVELEYEYLIKDLQKSLRAEQVLRKVSGFFLSDNSIGKNAKDIAEVLGNYLKVDRCILHDYKNGKTVFVSEYHNQATASMIDADKPGKNLDQLAQYINFQKQPFENLNKVKESSAVVVHENINNNSKPAEIEEIYKQNSIVSQISLITSVNNKINGGIYLQQSFHRDFQDKEIELVKIVAEQFAIAVNRSHCADKVIFANSELLEKNLELKNTLKEEKRMRKMQNEFVAMVSHEFKTPLQIIDSTRELIAIKLRRITTGDISVEKYLIKIKNAISRMNSLIQSTLNLSRIEMAEGKIGIEKLDFGIKNLINEIIDKNSTLASDKNIQIITDIQGLPELFFGDPKLLDHCFTNIITNAIKYSKNDSQIKIIGGFNGKNIFVRVIDFGIGIPKDDVANVGRKFFRAKNTLAVAGTGIGLYLTKYFINLHNGSLAVESDLGAGTTASILLPIIRR